MDKKMMFEVNIKDHPLALNGCRFRLYNNGSYSFYRGKSRDDDFEGIIREWKIEENGVLYWKRSNESSEHWHEWRMNDGGKEVMAAMSDYVDKQLLNA